MKIQALRAAAFAAVCCLSLAALSCDALNPALVGQLGGDAGSVNVDPTGSIVIVFNNQTNQEMALRYEADVIRPGGGTEIQPTTFTVAPASWWATTLDCYTSSVTLIGISTAVGATQPSDISPTIIPIAANTFTRPALQCGSVIFVNLPLIGSPTADLLP